MNEQDIVYRLEKRAEIRRAIQTRKSVQEGKPDRIADLLDEAAREIKMLRATEIDGFECLIDECDGDTVYMRAKAKAEEDESDYQIEVPRDKLAHLDLCVGLILDMKIWSDERITFETIPRSDEDIRKAELAKGEFVGLGEKLAALLDQFKDDKDEDE